MSMTLFQAVERVARRFRRERLWSSLAICWIVWALLGWGMSTSVFQEAAGPFEREWVVGSIACAALVSAGGCVIWALRKVRDPRWVARRIEAKHPELKTGLLAAVEEISGSADGRLGYLQFAVVKKAARARAQAGLERNSPHLDAAGSDAGSCNRATGISGCAGHAQPAGAVRCSRRPIAQGRFGQDGCGG